MTIEERLEKAEGNISFLLTAINNLQSQHIEMLEYIVVLQEIVKTYQE